MSKFNTLVDFLMEKCWKGYTQKGMIKKALNSFHNWVFLSPLKATLTTTAIVVALVVGFHLIVNYVGLQR